MCACWSVVFNYNCPCLKIFGHGEETILDYVCYVLSVVFSRQLLRMFLAQDLQDPVTEVQVSPAKDGTSEG